MTRPEVTRAQDGSLNPACTDKRDNPTWSCIEFDGTGLWCNSCVNLIEGFLS